MGNHNMRTSLETNSKKYYLCLFIIFPNALVSLSLILLPSVLPTCLVLLALCSVSSYSPSFSVTLLLPSILCHGSLFIFLLILFPVCIHSSHYFIHTPPLPRYLSTPIHLSLHSSSFSLILCLSLLHSCRLATVKGCSLSKLEHTDREPAYSED